MMSMASISDRDELGLALKSAHDAMYALPGTPGHFIVIGAGSQRPQSSGVVRRGSVAGLRSSAWPGVNDSQPPRLFSGEVPVCDDED